MAKVYFSVQFDNFCPIICKVVNLKITKRKNSLKNMLSNNLTTAYVSYTQVFSDRVQIKRNQVVKGVDHNSENFEFCVLQELGFFNTLQAAKSYALYQCNLRIEEANYQIDEINLVNASDFE